MVMAWKTLNVRKLLEQLRNRREEATVSANVGAFQVPLGGVLRRVGLQKGYNRVRKLRSDKK